MDITPAMIEAAARVLAHREEFNASKWPKYAETAEWALREALAVAEEEEAPHAS